MPVKNSLKNYRAGGYYHVYNRGVEKRDIFLDEIDYSVFFSYLREYLMPKIEGDKKSLDRHLKNYTDNVDLLCHCLMPNHFHLLLKQMEERTISELVSSLTIKYSMYFNKRYRRGGRLFQGVFKAVEVTSNEQLVYLTKYIHLNPGQENALNYEHSSIGNYLGMLTQPWVKPEEILAYFSKTNPSLTYENFLGLGMDLSWLSKITIDD